ncbi:hypothetical protein HOU00_gp261 [Caulobacter phage CcrPW]|uniref:Uncharacterized protein n=1 Tax=Caulobacter phage CcrPW TaxID=2283271 RepID=A0A385EAH8_9CAUD|nr:hypothetical protein HOU00_gp261 [Caulobacter phage CcrPW]AXQ68864.1 hypothetical protein CcrPW_gp325 [Caulobacter phage CcrPW]
MQIGNMSDVGRDNDLLDLILQLLKASGDIDHVPRDAEYVEAYGAAVNVTLADGRTATILVSVD